MSRRASRRGSSIPVEDVAAVRRNVIVDPVGGFGVRPDAVAVDRHRARRRQLAALPPNEAEQRRAGLAAAQRDDERAHVGQLDRADEMVAIEKEGGILDLVKGARREDEGGAGAIDFLPNLARRLSVGIKVLEREGELAVDMAIILALLLGDRLGRQLFGIIIYRAVQRISAIFGEQHPRRGFEVRDAVAQIMFERRKAVETFVGSGLIDQSPKMKVAADRK